MKIIKGICPNCNGNLEISEGLTNGVCPFCGTTFFLDVEREEIRKVVYSKDTQNLLKRTFLLLEEGKFADALDKLDLILDEDPENGEAYLAKLMATLHVNMREDLPKLSESFADNINYKRAIRFGFPKLKEELAGYVDEIVTRNNRIAELETQISEVERLLDKAKKAVEETRQEVLTLLNSPEATNLMAVGSLLDAGWVVALTNLIEQIRSFDVESINMQTMKEELNNLKGKIAEKIQEKKITLNDMLEGFGNYGNQPLEWITLAKNEEGDKALLITKNVVDAKDYSRDILGINEEPWEDCSLRGWLNYEFLDKAFTKKERKLIDKTVITGVDNSSCRDYVFLLSAKEIRGYMKDNESRICAATEYAKEQGVFTVQGNHCCWWLRPTGRVSNEVPIVDIFGKIDEKGVDVFTEDCGVRPAIWVNIPKE